MAARRVKRFAARGKVVLADIEVGDVIAYDLMVWLAGELAALGKMQFEVLEGLPTKG